MVGILLQHAEVSKTAETSWKPTEKRWVLKVRSTQITVNKGGKDFFLSGSCSSVFVSAEGSARLTLSKSCSCCQTSYFLLTWLPDIFGYEIPVAQIFLAWCLTCREPGRIFYLYHVIYMHVKQQKPSSLLTHRASVFPRFKSGQLAVSLGVGFALDMKGIYSVAFIMLQAIKSRNSNRREPLCCCSNRLLMAHI